MLLLHGHTASADMFLLPETRNLVDVLLDDGYEPWLLDWRGSCRLPYNETGRRYTYDDVALYDIPEAVAHIRGRIGERPLFAVAHCIGSLTLSLSMAAGLVPGLAGVVSQGVFLTPKLAGRTSLRMSVAGELLKSRIDHIPVDFRKVGLWSKYTPLFALAARKASCPDPTCQILHHSAWGSGASLFVHENLAETTHDRLAELLGPAPLWILPHLRRIELARSVVRWHDTDHRYRALPPNALDAAARIDTPCCCSRAARTGCGWTRSDCATRCWPAGSRSWTSPTPRSRATVTWTPSWAGAPPSTSSVTSSNSSGNGGDGGPRGRLPYRTVTAAHPGGPHAAARRRRRRTDVRRRGPA
ncbi:hypothetical protein O1M54_46330 [Streptomyces diastatochromogenes]|nr:hypothetical protein [Streptomyces diastatochromogenes]